MRRLVRHPSQVIVLAFGSVIAAGTVLLLLPVSRTGDGAAPLVTALFTATSAVCVTGLITVDTGGYWSGFGEAVILGLIQIGGFGIMTMASLLGVLISRRIGLRAKLTAAAETKALSIGDVRSVVGGIARVTIAFEAVLAVILALRLVFTYDEPIGRAAYLGLFHAISAFNNAGFSLYEDSLMRFVGDPVICLPVAVAVIAGGIGFPVILELRRRVPPRQWSLHAKLTVVTTVALLAIGTVVTVASEWSNAATLGTMGPTEKLHAAFFHSAMSRTAGFNSIDIGAMSEGSWLATIALMFIGGGSAGTAGGIKVTTFVVLLLAIVSEVRGDQDSNAFGRRIATQAQRQALAVALLGVAAVVGGTLILIQLDRFTLGEAMFEVTSAFGTVGLSTGITADLSAPAQVLMVILMFLGRLGPITLASSLALRQRQQLFRLPEGRSIIG